MQLKKDIKSSESFVQSVISLFQAGLTSHPNTLIYSFAIVLSFWMFRNIYAPCSFGMIYRPIIKGRIAMRKLGFLPGDFGGNAHMGTRSHLVQSFGGLFHCKIA